MIQNIILEEGLGGSCRSHDEKIGGHKKHKSGENRGFGNFECRSVDYVKVRVKRVIIHRLSKWGRMGEIE